MYGYAYSLYNQVPFGRGGIDPAAAAYFTSTGITGATEQTAIDNLVKGLKSDGLWSKMKAIYPFVTDNRNLFGYTEDLTNAAWSKSGVSVTSGQLDPNGGTTAFRVQGTTIPKALYQSPTLTTGQTHTISFYIKRNGGTNQTFRLFGNNSVVSSDFTATSSWQQFTLTLTGTSGLDFGITRDSANNNYDILVWHPQLELGSTATTYQPITTTQQAFISSQFKYNLVNPVDSDAAFRLVFNGGWTHSANGATPNGTNGYADTKLVPSSVLTLNSTHLSYYSRTSSIVNGQRDIAVFVDGGQPCMSLGTNTGAQISDSYNFITNRVSASIANALGFVNASRVSSTSHKLYKSGAQIGTTDAFANVSTLPNQNIYLGAANITPNPTLISGYSSKQVAFSTIGDGLTDTEAANLYTRVQAFQTALSRQV